VGGEDVVGVAEPAFGELFDASRELCGAQPEPDAASQPPVVRGSYHALKVDALVRDVGLEVAPPVPDAVADSHVTRASAEVTPLSQRSLGLAE
jgi:hypothetical protein